VVDDEERENEGDFVALSTKATPEMINFMVREGRGLVCTTITEERAADLELAKMTDNSTDPFDTAFTVSIDHQDTTTGISAFERSKTIRSLIDSGARAADFKQPGHVFPIVAKSGGVLERPGHTEASVDLAVLCEAPASGVICEILNDDGTMARVPDLQVIARKHSLKIITIEALIAYRKQHELLIDRVVETTLPTDYGIFKLFGYTNQLDQKEHIALVKGDLQSTEPVLVRVHSECLTGDVFSSYRCDCGPQLEIALQKIAASDHGVLIYMEQEGRGIGLLNKLKAYELQDTGLDTVEANEKLGFESDLREYDLSAHILADLQVKNINLLTNNPQKMISLQSHGININERIPIETKEKKDNQVYLQTKYEKMGHLLG
ncbi:MAG TPA: bifunctional 3,4-dihydroxy-2-butanone-4-phosphate synthase/GTP cyclohydrolase II, partial [Virgibacillus sp.]|nr:bifunctional 3,4-dihydroxy-2-butanone-4-phosphate synthase/GTP cyclohydrolase II [Virgibacillus sp.]